jgi:hypothetical protein
MLVAFRWWPSLAETCKGLILLLKPLLHLVEFNPNFIYMLYSAMAKDSVYHKENTFYLTFYFCVL